MRRELSARRRIPWRREWVAMAVCAEALNCGHSGLPEEAPEALLAAALAWLLADPGGH